MAKPALAPTYQIANNTTMPAHAAQVHDRFTKIEIHTAKCDICDQRNTATIYRCLTCGQQTCTPCVNRIAGTDGIHFLKYIIPPMISAKKRKKALQQNEVKTKKARGRKSKILRKGNDADEPIESGDETQSDVGAETPRSYAASWHQRSAEKAEPNSGKTNVNESSYMPQFPLEEKLQARPYNYPHTPPSEKHTQHEDFLIHDDPVTSRSTAIAVLPPRLPAATISNTYISTIPRYHSDYDGILALLQAAEHIEKMAQRPFPLPAALSTPSPSVSHSSRTTLGNNNSISSETASEEATDTLNGKWSYRLPPGQSISNSISHGTYTPNDCYHSPSKSNETMYLGVVPNDTLSPQNPPRTLTPYVSDGCIFPTPPRKLTLYVPAEVNSLMSPHTRGRKGFDEDKDTKFPVPRRSLTPYIYERPKFPVPPRTGTPDFAEEEKESNYQVLSQTKIFNSPEDVSSLSQDAQPRSPLFVHASLDVDLKTQSSLGLSSQKPRESLAQAAVEAGVERDLFQTECGKTLLQKANIENDSDATISMNEEECTVIQQKTKRISLVDYDETEDELELEEVQEDTDW